MEIPDLVRQELGDEEIRAGVNLGDEDAACFTATRTLVYRGEGLLSDERVDVYSHDFERLTVSEGRRKTKFTLVYVDEKLELTVPGNRGDAVLERLLEGKLRVDNVLAAEEAVAGVFRFSELTLVVTDHQLLKHIGNVTWDADFERYGFEDVTGLEFEEGSVATAVVLSVDDRPERIKAPSEQAPSVRKTLQEALFAFHEVASIDELNAKVGSESEEESDAGGGLGLESGIDPLVSDDSDDDTDEIDAPSGSAAEPASAEPGSSSTGGSSDADAASAAMETPQTEAATAADAPSEPSVDGESRTADVAALEEQVQELAETVEAQTEQLEKQERTIKQLIKELRQGR